MQLLVSGSAFSFALVSLVAPAMADEAIVDASAVETLPVIVIEGRAPERPIVRDKTIHLSTGFGAKALESPRNELGIELRNMERFEEISTERRAQAWWLRIDEGEVGQWRSQAHADLSLDQKFRLRSHGVASGLRTSIEGGYSRDHRDLILIENRENPYDSGFEKRVNVGNVNDRSYLSVGVGGRRWRTLGDVDEQNEDIHAGSLLTGKKTVEQQQLSGRWRTGSLSLMPFAQLQQRTFHSALSPLLSNETRAWRGGLQMEFAGGSDGDSVEPSLSVESMDRTLADQARSRFQRVASGALVTREFSAGYVDLALNLGGEAAFDQIEGAAGQGETQSAIWNFAGEVSSPKRNRLGLVGRFKRFSLMPTPTQRFGDGALLVGSPDLGPETGVRVGLGSWLKGDDLEFEVTVFYERSKDAPVAMAVSSTAARTMPIGGVWARGIEASGGLRKGLWSWKMSYGLQEAVNDSEIAWQRGKPVPGRPKHILKTNLDYGKRGWKSGLSYGYQSEDALDLSGLWFAPPKHELDAYVGYAARRWEARLTGGKLLASLNGLPTAQFAGRASPDLLQPKIEQTEVRLQCEFLM